MTIYAKIEGVEYIVDFNFNGAGAVTFTSTKNYQIFVFHNRKMTVKSAVERIKELTKNQ